MRIAFVTPDINFRGSCVALYDYAEYCESMLGHTSVILAAKKGNCDPKAFKWLSNRFPVCFFDNLDEAMDGIDCFYCIKYGKRDGLETEKRPSMIHCVFDMSEPHGTVYAGVSKSLALKFGSGLFVPHMVRPHLFDVGNLRNQLNIPKDAIVFGRHGGQDTFNLGFAKSMISLVVRSWPMIYFVFLNAPKWDMHPQIIYLDATTDREEKCRFINTCDAMIVPETMGHSFGLSVAEFSVANKPVVCYAGSVWNTSHIDILGDKGIYFQTEEDLFRILTQFKRCEGDWNAYREYSPEKVMAEFDRVFLASLGQS